MSMHSKAVDSKKIDLRENPLLTTKLQWSNEVLGSTFRNELVRI